MEMYARYSRVKEVNRALLLEQIDWLELYLRDEEVSEGLWDDVQSQASHWLHELGGLMGVW